MSDTPETDAFIDSLNDDFDYEFAALTTHAKKLERERDIAQIWSSKWKELARALRTDRDITKWERDKLLFAGFKGAME